MYGIQRPPVYESKDSFGMQGWFQKVWGYVLSRVNLTTPTAAYTATNDVFYIRGDGTSGAFSVSLPSAVGLEGRQLVVKKIDSSANAITIDPNSTETLDGSTTVALSAQYDSRHFISNGVNWELLNQGVDADLTGLSGLTTTGIVVRTGAGTYTTRSLTQPAAGITIANSDGVSGSPTFALANDLAALEGLGSTGIAVRSASDTWVQRTIAGTANQIEVANGNGVSGNPTLSLSVGTVLSGTYTPTLTNTTNVAASTAYSCQYTQIGSVVIVSGQFDAQPTAATAATVLEISLPVASNLSAANELAGTFWASAVFSGGAILGDATDNRANANWIAGDTTNRAFFFTFMYRII